MSDLCKIMQGDWIEQLNTLPDESVQCCVTSPPYDSLRTYGGFSWDFQAGAQHLYRVMCDGGIMCWNVNDSVVNGSETLNSFRQAIYFKDVCHFNVHDTMIYEKSNGSKPDPTRYNPCMEYIFILSKGKPRCFNPIKDKKNVTAGKPCFGIHTMREKDGRMTDRKERKVAAEYGTRSNVWKGLTRGQEDAGLNLPHPAMMPSWLARDLILSWSNTGDTVLDPLAGSGTTGVAALELGRKAILIESNPDYVKLIEARTNVTPGFQMA